MTRNPVQDHPVAHAAEIVREYGPFAGADKINGVSHDGRRVWAATGTKLVAFDPASGDMKVWRAPRGVGPYGITTTPSGDVFYASLAGNHIAQVDLESGKASVIEPPTPNQGARRIWSDSKGRVWVSYWNTGQVGMYDPAARAWREWKLPGVAHAYAVYVDEQDKVWLTDWSTNALVRFDPLTEKFDSYASNQDQANVRQLAGRAGEVWGAESGNDRLVMVPLPQAP